MDKLAENLFQVVEFPSINVESSLFIPYHQQYILLQSDLGHWYFWGNLYSKLSSLLPSWELHERPPTSTLMTSFDYIPLSFLFSWAKQRSRFYGHSASWILIAFISGQFINKSNTTKFLNYLWRINIIKRKTR